MLVLSVIFVYMLMAFFFESTLVPLSIIMTIPLAAMGSIGILKLFHTFIDQMVYTGAMFLVGLVVNNGIALSWWIMPIDSELEEWIARLLC